MAIVDIDPDGDVIVKIGDDDLRVASQVLCLASPVFKAMLRSGFKEGLTAETSSQNPKHIALPDDDPTAFKTLCRVIHFRLDMVPDKLDVDSLQQLAGLCDKYRIIIPMLNCATLWVRKLASDGDMKTLVRLLVVAVLLDLPEAFDKTSRALLRTFCGQVKYLKGCLREHGLVNVKILGE